MKAINRRIEFLQNLGYKGKLPLLDTLITLRDEINMASDAIDMIENEDHNEQKPA